MRQQGRLLLEALGENPFLGLSRLLEASHIPWFMTSRHSCLPLPKTGGYMGPAWLLQHDLSISRS